MLSLHVEVAGGVGHLEGGHRVVEQRLAAEVLLAVATVDGHLASAGNETHARHRVLAAAGAVVQSLICHD